MGVISGKPQNNQILTFDSLSNSVKWSYPPSGTSAFQSLEIPAQLWKVDNENWRDTFSEHSVINLTKSQTRIISVGMVCPQNLEFGSLMELALVFSMASNQAPVSSVVFQLDVRYTNVNEPFNHLSDQTSVLVAPTNSIVSGVRCSNTTFLISTSGMLPQDYLNFSIRRLIGHPQDITSGMVRFNGASLRYVSF